MKVHLESYDIEKEKKDISIIVANSLYEDIFLPLFATLFLGLWPRLGQDKVCYVRNKFKA
jgi:hypothetical protein